jgi:hypothetical protein
VHEKLSLYHGDSVFLHTCAGNHIVRVKNKNHRSIDSLTCKDFFRVVWLGQQDGGDIGIIRDYALKEPDIALVDDLLDKILEYKFSIHSSCSTVSHRQHHVWG